MASGLRLTPELLRSMLQHGTERANRLDVDEPLLVMPDDPLDREATEQRLVLPPEEPWER